MITLSGIHVFPDGDSAPSIRDIAVGLSRMPRFAGQTTIPYTVAHHSLACANFAREERWLALHMLLHDAHEAVIGDVPRSWKTDDVRRLQDNLDGRIYRSLGIARPSMKAVERIKVIDNEILYAEACLLAPGCYEYFGRPICAGAALESVKLFADMSSNRVKERYIDEAAKLLPGMEITEVL